MVSHRKLQISDIFITLSHGEHSTLAVSTARTSNSDGQLQPPRTQRRTRTWSLGPSLIDECIQYVTLRIWLAIMSTPLTLLHHANLL